MNSTQRRAIRTANALHVRIYRASRGKVAGKIKHVSGALST